MTLDQIDQLVREANPVPDPRALDPVDASGLLDEHGTIGTPTLAPVAVDETRPPAGRRVLVAVAAVAVIVCGIAVILARGDGDLEADRETAAVGDLPTAEAVEIATGFVDAYRRHDADRAASYLTVDALESEFGDLEGLKLETRWQAQTGFEVLPGRCELRDISSSGITVRCPYEFHGLRSEELGLGPFGDNYLDLTIRDGAIVSVSDKSALTTNGFSYQVWEPFADWVADTHPDDVTVMYTSRSQSRELVTEDSVPIWGRRTSEYLEQQLARTRVRLVGLPPEGATPSTPERGEVVLSSGRILGRGYNKGLSVYADGRVIWFQHGPGPDTVDDFHTGLYERRLTPEGIDLLVSEITSTGLFGPDDGPFLVGEGDTGDFSYVNDVRVEGLSSAPFRSPELYLPESAWEDSEVRAFVPSHYAVCYEPAVLDLLPATGRDLLAAKVAVPDTRSEGDDVCVDMITDEARLIAGAIDEELQELGGSPGAISEHVLSYRFDAAGLSQFDSIWFKPYTPDGMAMFPVYG